MSFPVAPKYDVLQVLADKWWIGLLSLAVALVATPIVRAIAYRHKIVDKPDNLLKPHGRPVAYLGGLAIFAGLLAGLVAYLLVMPDLAKNWQDLKTAMSHPAWYSSDDKIKTLTNNPLWQLLAIILASALIMVIGLIDDLRVLKPRQKVLGQLLAAAILIIGGIAHKTSIVILISPLFDWGGAIPPMWLVLPTSALMCMIIVVGACNATNLLDGMDGLCGGVTAIIAVGFLALAVWLAMWKNIDADGNGIRVCLCLSMAGAVLGFLPYNLSPASIFMGDAGSMLLGFFVATMMCLFCIEGTARWLVASCVVFSLPILDTGLAVVRRFLAGRPIFPGDRSHLYDQLQDRGMTVKQVVALFYVLASAAAVIGVTLSITMRLRQALPIYCVLLIVVILIFLLLGMMTPQKK